MINFARYLFIILALTLILPLACLFFYSNRQISNMEHATATRILDTVSREINYNIENHLKVETVNTMDKIYKPGADKFTKKDIQKALSGSKVEFLKDFPEEIIYYYKVEQNRNPELYSVIVLPFFGKDFSAVKVTKKINPAILKLSGPFFVELYFDNKIDEKNLIGYIAPVDMPKDFPWFNKRLSMLPLGIPQDKRVLYKIFNMDKKYTRADVSILIKTSWHISPVNLYERRTGLIIILLGIFLSIFVARYINLNFINPFLKISAASKRVKSGDLNLVLKTGIKQKTVQETYTNFNDMVKGLKEKEELRSGFIRNLTHDLRTPLIAQERALSMISNKFSELKLQEEKELAHSLEKNTSHLLRMVNLILESYQFNLNKENLNFEVINASKMVDECFIKIKPLADEKNISLINNIDENCNINTDITCFERILINLCANAIENLQNSGYIKISSEISDSDIKITVEDNGRGIPEEDIEHIFDRYFSSKSYNRKIGSGLGLDVVKKLTEIINGKIELESKVSKYTKFTIAISKN